MKLTNTFITILNTVNDITNALGLLSTFTVGVKSVFRLVISMQCYSCSSSDVMNCEDTQLTKTCSRRKEENVCLTITYSYRSQESQNSTKIKTRYRKTCATGRIDCNLYCRMLSNSGENECKVRYIYKHIIRNGENS